MTYEEAKRKYAEVVEKQGLPEEMLVCVGWEDVSSLTFWTPTRIIFLNGEKLTVEHRKPRKD